MVKLNKKIVIALIIIALPILWLIVFFSSKQYSYVPEGDINIFLYGETHGKKSIMEKEYYIWEEYYNNFGMRHLFIEDSYFTAEFLNIWMTETEDTILLELYEDWAGTYAQNPDKLEFYRKIKTNLPETVFHGTDVGHQYNSIGERYLLHLEDAGQKDTEKYQIAVENIEQAKIYYVDHDEEYREDALTMNFIREYDKLKGEQIMGIYGSLHVNPFESASFKGDDVESMSSRLINYYGEIIQCESVKK